MWARAETLFLDEYARSAVAARLDDLGVRVAATLFRLAAIAVDRRGDHREAGLLLSEAAGILRS